MTSIKQQKGQQAELNARHYLEQHGLVFIDKNFTCPHGEIDLIMNEKDVFVFVEVRFRKQKTYGSSLESINHYKQNKIIRSAQYYLQHKNLFDKVHCRFDCVGIDSSEKIIWIKDAFQVQY